MKIKLTIFAIFCILLICSCSQEKETKGELQHIVLFSIKSENHIENLLFELKKLEAIPEVQSLEVGTFEDLGDPRALRSYQVVLKMGFNNMKAYEAYQSHKIHQKVKKASGELLDGPPASYDYLVK